MKCKVTRALSLLPPSALVESLALGEIGMTPTEDKVLMLSGSSSCSIIATLFALCRDSPADWFVFTGGQNTSIDKLDDYRIPVLSDLLSDFGCLLLT